MIFLTSIPVSSILILILAFSGNVFYYSFIYVISDILHAFTRESVIGNLLSIHLEVNILRRVAKSEGRPLPFSFLLKSKIIGTLRLFYLDFHFQEFIYYFYSLKSINDLSRCFTIWPFLICLHIALLLKMIDLDSNSIL